MCRALTLGILAIIHRGLLRVASMSMQVSFWCVNIFLLVNYIFAPQKVLSICPVLGIELNWKNFICRQAHNIYAYMHTKLHYFFILYTVFYNIFLKNTNSSPLHRKLTGEFAENFLFSTESPPPLPPPYCDRALFLSAIALCLSRHLNTALPTHQFFSSTFFLVTQP